MADVSHELGALRFVVDSPLSSKVAMFNNQATQHKQSQLLNPFSHDGRASSPKPTFSKDQYGKPLAGSLTEMRGQKANMHVMKEMLELCQIIDSEGYQVKDEPTMRVIPFGELFNIYNYISDKVVGILLRARKHKLLEFEGEMLYQRRDDDVPIFLLRPIKDIRHELNAKIEEIKRGASPAPQSTSVLLDKSAHEQKLKSRTPSPAVKSKAKSKSKSPSPPVAAASAKVETAVAALPVETAVAAPSTETAVVAPPVETVVAPAVPVASAAAVSPSATPVVVVDQPVVEITPAKEETSAAEKVEPASESQPKTVPAPLPTAEEEPTVKAAVITEATTEESAAVAPVENAASPAEVVAPVPVPQAVDVPSSDNLPTIIIEASATFVRTVSVEQLVEEPKPEMGAPVESA